MSKWTEKARCDKVATDPYIPMVKAICGVYVISEAPLIEDQKHATDLMVLCSGESRIAVRLRTPYYWQNKGDKNPWRKEFTIRDSRPNGVKTEFAKIMEGWVDYFFYGFRHPNIPHLYGFGLIELTPFREWCLWFRRKHGVWPGDTKPNPDQSSDFRVIEWKMIPPQSILVMYPKGIALGNTLITEEKKQAVQFALQLYLDFQSDPRQGGFNG